MYLLDISYPLFASADARIYPNLALQYHAWPSVIQHNENEIFHGKISHATDTTVLY